jgi:hypothetical protein
MSYVLVYIFMGFFSAGLGRDVWKDKPADGWILILFWPLLIPMTLGVLIGRLRK